MCHKSETVNLTFIRDIINNVIQIHKLLINQDVINNVI